jgi:SHAQKYF class myb-like DNA-binding protein
MKNTHHTNKDTFHSEDTIVSDQTSVCSDDITFDAAQHRALVEAIFHTGLQSCSPSILLEEMMLKSDDITSERVKSHLQKFRKKGDLAVEEFMESYDSAMKKYDDLFRRPSSLAISSADLQVYTDMFVTQGKADGCLLAGEAAANLTVADMLLPIQDTDMCDGQNDKNATSSTGCIGDSDQKVSIPADPMLFMMQFLQGQSLTSVQLPVLTEEEKDSPLGASLCYIMGLFMSLRQHINDKRNESKSSERLSNSKPSVRGTVRTSLTLDENDYEPQNKRRAVQVSDHSTDSDIERDHDLHPAERDTGTTSVCHFPSESIYRDLIDKVPLDLNEYTNLPGNIADLDMSSHTYLDRFLSRLPSIETNDLTDQMQSSNLDPLPFPDCR